MSRLIALIATTPNPDFIAIWERVAKNPMKRGAQTRANAWLKRHGTQVWKPAIRQAGKPALQWFAMVLPVSP
jgi:hypothetical protein